MVNRIYIFFIFLIISASATYASSVPQQRYSSELISFVEKFDTLCFKTKTHLDQVDELLESLGWAEKKDKNPWYPYTLVYEKNNMRVLVHTDYNDIVCTLNIDNSEGAIGEELFEYVLERYPPEFGVQSVSEDILENFYIKKEWYTKKAFVIEAGVFDREYPAEEKKEPLKRVFISIRRF